MMNARRHTQFGVVHCSATRASADIGADEIHTWHLAKEWDGIGYHQVIRRDGQIEFGRHFDEWGAHVVGYNTRSIGICLIGGVAEDGTTPEDNFTVRQFDSLAASIAFHSRAYPGIRWVGHRDLSPDLDGDGIIEPNEWLKACPCFDVAEFLMQRGLNI